VGFLVVVAAAPPIVGLWVAHPDVDGSEPGDAGTVPWSSPRVHPAELDSERLSSPEHVSSGPRQRQTGSGRIGTERIKGTPVGSAGAALRSCSCGPWLRARCRGLPAVASPCLGGSTHPVGAPSRVARPGPAETSWHNRGRSA